VKVSCEHYNKPSGFHKMLEYFWAALQLPASQEGLSSMELVSNIESAGPLQ
jgi:hypothetical protein